MRVWVRMKRGKEGGENRERGGKRKERERRKRGEKKRETEEHRGLDVVEVRGAGRERYKDSCWKREVSDKTKKCLKT